MFSEEINNLASIAVKKHNLLKKSKSRYLTSSALAGMYIGFGIILIVTIGGYLNAVHSPATKIVMGLSFSVALSLVLAAGGELFTSNNMLMTIGAIKKKITWKNLISVWVFCYIGNFIGSIILAYLYAWSGLASGGTGEYIIKMASAKMEPTTIQLFIRGIFCNMLVCASVWCYFKLKEEAGKLIMVFWCIYAFITSGFEHSVANMTLLSLALIIPHKATISIGTMIHNLVPVTLGNIVGGAIFIGLAYCYISKE